MHELVHGISANVTGGCRGPDLREAAQSHSSTGRDQSHYVKGVHTPVRLIFWIFNDIADQSTFNVLGVR
eukprot:6387271-Pyramimonas_sp.AAC.1